MVMDCDSKLGSRAGRAITDFAWWFAQRAMVGQAILILLEQTHMSFLVCSNTKPWMDSDMDSRLSEGPRIRCFWVAAWSSLSYVSEELTKYGNGSIFPVLFA